MLHVRLAPIERPSRRWAGLSGPGAQERRRIKRRIANRESARRVRARRQGALEEMLQRVRGALLRAQCAVVARRPSACSVRCCCTGFPLEHVWFHVSVLLGVVYRGSTLRVHGF